jgi:hypothetical protein
MKIVKTSLFVIIFAALGALVAWWIQKVHQKNGNDYVIEMLEDEINDQAVFFIKYHQNLMMYGDTNYQEYHNVKAIADWFVDYAQRCDILRYDLKNGYLRQSGIDTLILMLNVFSENTSHCFDNLLLQQILRNMNNLKPSEALFSLDVVENFILNLAYRDLTMVSNFFSDIKVVNIAEKDTVNYGDMYTSDFYFDIRDFTGKNMLIIDNHDTCRYGIFEEKVTVKGEKRHVFDYYYLEKNKVKIYHDTISYRVK